MSKKEKRLSPKARKLLEVARTKFSTQPEKAAQYLMSIKPSELTMYDRQKIGREIIARSGGNYHDQFTKEIVSNYQVPLESQITRGHKKSKGEKRYGVPGRIRIMDESKHPYKYSLKRAESYRNHGNYFEAYLSHMDAAFKFKNAGKIDEAIECYTEADEDYKKINDENQLWHLRFGRMGDHKAIEELEKLKVEKLKKHGLETTLTTAAIVGLLGGIFFLSTNITGNVTGLNQTSSNYLGAVLLVVGLIGGFFWIRKRK